MVLTKKKFSSGDLVKFNKDGYYTAQSGALAVVNFCADEIIDVIWIRNELSGRQADGGYYTEDFVLECAGNNRTTKIIDKYGIAKFCDKYYAKI